MKRLTHLKGIAYLMLLFSMIQETNAQIKRKPITPDISNQGVPQIPDTEVKTNLNNPPSSYPPIIIKQEENIREIVIKKPQKDDITIEGLLQLSFGNEPIMLKFPELKGRYFNTESLAYRGTLAFELGTNNQDLIDGRNTLNVKTTVQNITAGGGVEFHVKSSKRVSPYYGAEALIIMNSTKINGTNTDNLRNYSLNSSYLSDSSTTGIYLGALAGLDYYLSSEFYFGIEVGLGLTSYTNSKVGERTALRGQTITEKDVSSGGGTLIGHRFIQGIRVGFKF